MKTTSPLIIFLFAFLLLVITIPTTPVLAQSTHTFVANPGPGNKPSSVPWSEVITLLRKNDTRTWNLKFTCSMEEFVEVSAKLWRCAATNEAVAKIIEESAEVPYKSSVHGPQIEHNTGVNKITKKLEVVDNHIPEGYMILIHPVLGPVAKSDCNNPLEPVFDAVVEVDLEEEEDSIVYIPGKVTIVYEYDTVYQPCECKTVVYNNYYSQQQQYQRQQQPYQYSNCNGCYQQPYYYGNDWYYGQQQYSYWEKPRQTYGYYVDNTIHVPNYDRYTLPLVSVVPPSVNNISSYTRPPSRPAGNSSGHSGGCCGGVRPNLTSSFGGGNPNPSGGGRPAPGGFSSGGTHFGGGGARPPGGP